MENGEIRANRHECRQILLGRSQSTVSVDRFCFSRLRDAPPSPRRLKKIPVDGKSKKGLSVDWEIMQHFFSNIFCYQLTSCFATSALSKHASQNLWPSPPSGAYLPVAVMFGQYVLSTTSCFATRITRMVKHGGG